MKNLKFLSIPSLLLFAACQSATPPVEETATELNESMVKEEKMAVVYDTTDVSTMIAAIEEANGGTEALRALKNVEYDYYYLKPDSTIDISKERYIFEDETSWAKYTTHQVNVPAELEGDVVQFYDGKSASCYIGGEMIEDEKTIGMGQFLRQANYMWFNMMFKFQDPGVIANYNGRKEHKGKLYDMIDISYDSTVTGKAQNDAYVLYVNPETHLVDYFNFSLPALGVNVPALHAELTYEEIDGIQVVTKRMMYTPNPETGEMGVMVDQELKNVSFNNGFDKESLAKEV